MDIDKLYELSRKYPEASKRAAEGFEERLKKREKEFKKESESLKPRDGFYERRYDI